MLLNFRLRYSFSGPQVSHDMKSNRLQHNFKGRIPRQVRRNVPAYFIFLLFILLFGSSANTFLESRNNRDTLKSFLPQSISPKILGSSRENFPKKFWQIWKVGPLHFEERDLIRARTWTSMNIGYRYEVLTDDSALPWVEKYFGPGGAERGGLDRPDIVYAYQTIRTTIIKADILRYLVMFVEGGTYADIDVESLKPIDEFIPARFKKLEKDIDLVVGIEIDQPSFRNHPILGSKSISFVQWTFMCKPRLHVMIDLVDSILVWINEVARQQNAAISDVVLDFDQVISGTGPTALTMAVLAEMSRQNGQEVTWDTFHNMDEPKIVGGILVLTTNAFAAGQGHSNAGAHSDETAMIRHHYHASKWPLKHPRYKHPVYGQAEDCNWNVECVAQWDLDTAAFKELLPLEQERRIGEKEAADIEAKELQALAEKAQADIEAMNKEIAELDAADLAQKKMDEYCRRQQRIAQSKEDSKKRKKPAPQRGDHEVDLDWVVPVVY